MPAGHTSKCQLRYERVLQRNQHVSDIYLLTRTEWPKESQIKLHKSQLPGTGKTESRDCSSQCLEIPASDSIGKRIKSIAEGWKPRTVRCPAQGEGWVLAGSRVASSGRQVRNRSLHHSCKFILAVPSPVLCSFKPTCVYPHWSLRL